MEIKNGFLNFTNKECEQIKRFFESGLSIRESFCRVIEENNINNKLVKNIIPKNNKYYWLFELLKMESYNI